MHESELPVTNAVHGADAVRDLCALLRRGGTRAHRLAARYDYRGWPRAPELHAIAPLTPELARRLARDFLEAAVAALEPLHPDPPDGVSCIRVLREHVLEGLTWEAMLAVRRETGEIALSERTLKNRQREAFERIAEWASATGETLAEPGTNGTHADAAIAADPHVVTSAAESAVPAQSQHVPSVDAPSPSRARRRWTIVAGLTAIAVVLVATTWRRAPQLSEYDQLPDHLLGRALDADRTALDAYRPELEELVPTSAFPSLGSAMRPVIAFRDPDVGRVRLFVGTQKGGTRPGAVVLYDPVTRSTVWETTFRPPKDRIRTHDSVSASAVDEAWEVGRLAYGAAPVTLGDRVAAIYFQRFSPTWVVFLDRRTGAVLSTYAHPGHVNEPAVIDVDGDGKAELVIGGTDNVRNEPVLVVLDPERAEGAASTVRWNEVGEAARLRLFLPVSTDLLEALELPRAHVGTIDLARDWNAETRTLVLGVGVSGDRMQRSFYATIDFGDPDHPTMEAGLGDAEQRRALELGVDPAALLSEARAGFEVVRRGDRS